ncbi:reverse transcriptase domain-containing protein [Tanacetum coccineum]
MRTRSQSRNSNRQQQQVNPTFVEPFNLVEPIKNQAPPVVMMADNRTMAQLFEAPTEGYEDAIVVPEITENNFELKHGLLTLVQNKQIFGHDKEDPHAHIRYFNKITSTMKFPNVPSTSVKLMLFPFSLEGAARIWLEKEPPRSILTWDDLVSKFINKFFPPSKTTNLRNEITRFQQRFDETFYEAWDRFNDLLRACPHHGFSELHQLDTFYNALNSNDQDSLNSAAGGNFLDKMPRDCLRIIESKSKVRNSRNKPVVAKVSAMLIGLVALLPGGLHLSDEAEYRGVSNVVAETAWLRNLLRELHIPLLYDTLIYCDNVSAIYMTANHVQHQRTKHIEIDIHFVRDMVARGQVRVLHLPSRYHYADIFTKGLPSALYEEFRTSLSVRSSPAQTAGAY